MRTVLERDLAALTKRFAADVAALIVRAPLGDLSVVLQKAPARPKRSAHDAEAWCARYRLTSAESAVLRAAAEGRTRDEIRRARQTSAKTVKRQIHSLLRKTGDASLLAAVARLLREG
jgi:DNA-binding NarL/FixJ family response regulator